jgi:PAS domain S-box-containing protein
MKDQSKTKARLISELEEMRLRVSELELTEPEQVKAKAALLIEKEFTDIALDAQLDTFFLFDPATNRAIRWNQSFKEISGYTDEEITKMPAPASYYSPKDLKKAEIFIQKVLEGGSGTIELELICKDGRKVPTEYRVSVINDDQGEPKYFISIGRDITARKLAEHALHEGLERLKGFDQHSTEGVYRVDITKPVPINLPQEEIVDWINKYAVIGEVNNSLAQMYGLESKDMLGRPAMEFAPNYGERAVLVLEKEGYQIKNVETEDVDKDGNPLYLVENYHGIVEDEHLISIWGAQKNITERVRAEEALRESEARMRSIFKASPTGIGLVSDRILLDVNEKICKMLGYSQEQLIGKNARVLYPTDEDYEYVGREKYAQIQEKGTGTVETRWERKDGKIINVLMSSTPLDLSDLSVGVTFTALDITEQKRVEALTHLRLRLFEFAESHSTVELLRKTLDEVGELTDSPIGFYHFVEEDQKTLTLQAWSTRTIEEFCQAEGEGLHYPINQAGVWADAVRQRHPLIHNDYSSLPDRKGMPEGHATVARELVVPIQRDDLVVAVLGVGNKPQEYTDKDLEIVSYLADVTWELTERKQAEQEREELIKKLEAQNAELERFTYTVSHDLKSPLVTIQGFLGYLEEDMATGNLERFKQDTQRIASAVDSMNNLLKDLLELSRIGRLMNPPEDVPFSEIAQEVLEILHGQLEAHGVAVTLEPNLPTVYGDRQRLKEVLQNLISNAAKFMGDQPDPHIEIGQEGEENGKPVFFVRDNGIGIEPEFHDRIFSLFERLNPETEGTGIGLALVKRIVEYHGGRIWVESEAEEGSIFYFSLPLKPAE